MNIQKHQDCLAYVYTKESPEGKNFPAVLFLSGFRSDMGGTKALYIEAFCKGRGQAFMRFDYSGHGLSAGKFEQGTLGGWTRDAQEILALIPQHKVILIGSSMGGWIALNLLLLHPDRISGVIGIAAAPDFTQGIMPRMSDQQRQDMERNGFIAVPTPYGLEPYIYTRRLIEDGRKHLLLERDHHIHVPLLLLQGKKDEAVPWQTAEIIREKFKGPRTEVMYIFDGDHRLSRPQDLDVLKCALETI